MEMPLAAESREKLEIPEGITIKYDSTSKVLEVSGQLGTMSRTFTHPKIKIEQKGKKVEIFCNLPKKKDIALFGTWLAHIKTS